MLYDRERRKPPYQADGPEYVNDVHYLKVFTQRLRRKLGDDPQRPRYIHTEWGIGYAFMAPAERGVQPSAALVVRRPTHGPPLRRFIRCFIPFRQVIYDCLPEAVCVQHPAMHFS